MYRYINGIDITTYMYIHDITFVRYRCYVYVTTPKSAEEGLGVRSSSVL